MAFEKGRLVVSGGVTAAGRDADFKARLRLGAGVGRRLRVNIEDLRVQGAPPLPLSAITAAVLAAFGSHVQGESPSEDSLEIDVLRPALDELLVAEGWRLPDCSTLRLSSAVVSLRGLELSWSDEATQAVPQHGPERTSQGYEPPSRRCGARWRRRRADRSAPSSRTSWPRPASAPNDEEGAVAALRICIENAAAGPLVGTAWRRLVELYARRGDPHAAARALIASADDSRTGASEAERAAALIAAAEILRKRLALPADAGMLLERAIALDPSSIEALEALEALTTETGAFERLADVLERKLQVAARGPVEQQEILTRLIQIYGGPVPRPDRARLLRERMAMIDLETTPMVPIPPPETRVGVPRARGAHGRPGRRRRADRSQGRPGHRSVSAGAARTAADNRAGNRDVLPGRRPSRRRRTRRRPRPRRPAAIWSARSRRTGARPRSRRSPPCARTTWWPTPACCSRAATSTPRAASSNRRASAPLRTLAPARYWRTSATGRRTGRGRASSTRCSSRRPTPPTSCRASCSCSAGPCSPIA